MRADSWQQQAVIQQLPLCSGSSLLWACRIIAYFNQKNAPKCRKRNINCYNGFSSVYPVDTFAKTEKNVDRVYMALEEKKKNNLKMTVYSI